MRPNPLINICRPSTAFVRGLGRNQGLKKNGRA
ncbi:hypothetical protein wcw_0379 [Waddlia chondrophila WSU 86-1044]|uniref:Uncharacterized protein n=1 Tax=Waddlia chondrophila (strain ATCC VR-1470 / WSU 86-1044) TaxID=716544 RepID=D6YUE0_WADCW|nr:hypothetical protein wcw_0379 [Waddlia chondrophila WSU 86-1044]